MSATQQQACQHLQSVRIRLADATKDYHDACRTLEASYSTISLTSLPRPFELQHTLLTVETELLQFSLDQDSARSSHQILKNIRDRSRMTAPIYSLPSEILSHVFSEAACHCRRAP
ncbi:hypothetical protein FRC09_010407, partial [Ceratobasidium sp. 395]